MPDDQNTPFFDANLARWDESVAIHAASDGYDMAGFLRGEKSLYPVEMDEVGDVHGKTLLHLQCHFGMDTLSWARLGASVTGLDFAPAAVARATQLATEIGIANARFVQSNVYDAPAAISEQFDIVYTGIGALCWLPDIKAWAKVVASFLRPGGFLYIYEGHPVLWALDEENAGEQLIVRYPYFEQSQPQVWEGDTTYVDGPPLKNTRTYEWNHGLGEIVSALIGSGLQLEFLHEHREMPWRALPWMVRADGQTGGLRYARRETWQLPAEQRELCPLMYSLRARKRA